MSASDKNLRIDVLSIGLLGLAVGALTLGGIQVHLIPQANSLAVCLLCLIFGGIVQIVAGIVDITHQDQLGGTALTMYGFFWTSVFLIKILNLVQGLQWDSIHFIPIVFVYMIFSAFMVYLTAHRSLSLMLLHIFITSTFTLDFLVKLGFNLEYYVGIGHLIIGFHAFYHALATLVNRFQCGASLPLGKPVLN
jgi:uncharacterized protein